MMDKLETLRLLSRHRTNEIVITTMTQTWIWPSITANADLDYPAYGVMGHAASVGLGVAIGRPDRRVWILNGDGSQLMYLGSIASIVSAGARNVVLFILQNDQYEMTGGQPIPGARRIDFAMVGKGLGMKNGYNFDSLSDLDAKLPGILKEEGPTIVALKIGTAEVANPRSPIMREEVRRFREVLARL